jgi:hypothetical protein
VLQAPVLNVSSVFSDVCCKCVLSGCFICFHTYDTSVLSEGCVCLQWFQMFFQVFLQVFRCMFQCFICF